MTMLTYPASRLSVYAVKCFGASFAGTRQLDRAWNDERARLLGDRIMVGSCRPGVRLGWWIWIYRMRHHMTKLDCSVVLKISYVCGSDEF